MKGLRSTRFPRGFRKTLHFQFIVKLSGDGTTLGMAHLRLEPGHLAGYLGLMIHHPFQGMGYGTEVVDAVVDFGFRKLNLHRIASSCDVGNAACVALLEATGFEYEGTMKDGAYHLQRGWVTIPSFARINPGSSRE